MDGKTQTVEALPVLSYQTNMWFQLKTFLTSILLLIALCFGANAKQAGQTWIDIGAIVVEVGPGVVAAIKGGEVLGKVNFSKPLAKTQALSVNPVSSGGVAANNASVAGKGARNTTGRVTNNYGPLNEGPLPTDIANTFRSGTYSEVVTTEPTKLYRVISDNGNPAGGYWTRTKPEGPVQSVIDSALDQNWGNTATRVVEMDVPVGTKLFEGAAAPQRGLVGGGNQIFFDRNINPLDPTWIR